MPLTEIAITGVGCVTSIGLGCDSFWQSLCENKSGVRDLQTLRSEDYPDLLVGDALRYSEAFQGRASLSVGAPLVDFDPKEFVRPRKALKVMSREIQTSFAASELAVMDSGLRQVLGGENSAWAIQPDRFGTVFGSEMLYGLPVELADAFAQCTEVDGRVDPSRFGGAAMSKVMPLWMLKYLPNMPACHYGIAINAHGPNNTITTGDVSGPSAVAEACGYLRRGIADVMVASAAGTRLNLTRSIFTEDQPLASPCEPIERSCRPHSIHGGGIVRGEGAASLILETLQSSAQRGVRPIAMVRGIASRFVASASMANGDRNSRTDATAGRASGMAMELAIMESLRQASCSLSDIGLVVAHGMGDPVIDDVERRVLIKLLPHAPVSLPVSLLGHCGSASGMIELATAVLCLKKGAIPPVHHAAECKTGLNVANRVRELKSPFALAICHTSPGAATSVVLSMPPT